MRFCKISSRTIMKKMVSFIVPSLIFCQLFVTNLYATDLSDQGIYVVLYPQQVALGGNDFEFGENLTVVVDENASDIDQFAASELLSDLWQEWGISGVLATTPGANSVILSHKNVAAGLSEQGYELDVDANKVTIKSASEAGLFYGTQPLLQLVKKGKSGVVVPGVLITDWPDIKNRAAHYDTKHHQDKSSYVKKLKAALLII